MQEALYRCELEYHPGDPDAASAWRYIARAEEHGQRPDQLVYMEAGNMPAWSKGGQCGRDYWEAADRYSRVGGRRYFAIYIGLPLGLSQDQHIQLTRAFADAVGRMSEDAQGRLPYTFALHQGYGRNPHAHLQLSQCINDGQSRSPGRWFRRADAGRPERGGARKSREVTRKGWLNELRATWERVANRLLAAWGTGLYIDRRSHAARGDHRIPTLPLGPLPLPGRPNPGREQRRLRNLEIERENRRREDERRREEAEAIKRREQLLQDAEFALKQLKAHEASGGTTYTCQILEPDEGRRHDLKPLLAQKHYQQVARHAVGADWECSLAHGILVWRLPLGCVIFDCGDRMLTTEPSAAAAAAMVALARTRTSGSVTGAGPAQWDAELRRALYETHAPIDRLHLPETAVIRDEIGDEAQRNDRSSESPDGQSPTAYDLLVALADALTTNANPSMRNPSTVKPPSARRPR